MPNDCRKCPKDHRKICETTAKMCAMAERYANGNIPRREKIAKPESLQHLPQSNYNDEIWVMMRDRETRDIERLDAIRAIKSDLPTIMRKKAILSMMLAEITQQQIGEILNITQPRVAAISKARVISIK